MDRLQFMRCLPVRPRPQPLESFSSYLVRSARFNGVSTPGTWKKILGLKWFSQRDMPLQDTGQMARLLDVCPERLQQMTFAAVQDKFGCDQRQLIALLTSVLAPYIRYCPLCLSDTAYYRLHWQLKVIPGCFQHGCYLQERCPNCGQTISLLKSPLQISLCRHCGADLTIAMPVRLSGTDLDITHMRTADMLYLIQDDDVSYQYPVSEKMARLRQLFSISQDDVARDLCVRKTNIVRFEHHRSISRLERYIDYADYLGLSLREVLAYREYDLSLPPQDVNLIRRVCALKRQDLINNARTFEKCLLDNVKQAVRQLRATRQSDSQMMIARQVLVEPTEMILYPRVKSYLEQVEKERVRSRVHTWTGQIQAAITRLDSENQPSFSTNISRIVGYNVQRLRYHPEIDALLTLANARAKEYIQVIEDGVPRFERRSVVAARIRTLLSQTEAQGIYLFKTEIANIVGARFGTLREDSVIAPLLEAHETRRIQTWYVQKHQALEQAYCQLRDNNERVTVNALERLTGLACSTIRRYESLWQRAQTLVVDYEIAHEAELLQTVQSTVSCLRATHERVTLNRIGQHVGMASNNLKRYPSIYAYLNTLPELPTPLKPPSR